MPELALEWREGHVEIRRVNEIGIAISQYKPVASISPTTDGITISGFDPKKLEIKQTAEKIEIKLI